MTDKDRVLLAKAIAIPDRVNKLSDAEYSVFSQWGDDGIIQYLTHHLKLSNNFFVEFGVENYHESNTRFLLMNNNWSGLVMDASKKNVEFIQSADYFWKYDLLALHSFVTVSNIVAILNQYCPTEIGLLHIDIDGMDYWIWNEISGTFRPDVVILEYNSVFGSDRSVTVPYQEDFNRHKAHYTGLYAGASLPALIQLSNRVGYAFVGANSAGNNAYFVRKELLNDAVMEKSIQTDFVSSRFRESRDRKGKLTYLSGDQRKDAIRGLPVFDTDLEKIIPF